MGYGHLRATYPLQKLAINNRVYLFGEESLDSCREGRLWHFFQYTYESISRIQQVPVIGSPLFGFMEKLMNISPYYPYRDLSAPSFQVKLLYWLIKRGLGKGLARNLSTQGLPIITSFYAAAMAAEEETQLPVYCIVCDTDINRVWVAENPAKSRIVYFAPCGHTVRRLRQYGVPDDRIYLTGFPLPDENIGGDDMPILRRDLWERLNRLDPSKRFLTLHQQEIAFYLGNLDNAREQDDEKPLTITYCVGGAGAQSELVMDVLRSLKKQICERKVRLNLVAGVRPSVAKYFMRLIKKEGLQDCPGIHVIYQEKKDDYFREFSRLLHDTDLLWTKPSELSFYCALGIPIIIAPPIGPHEVQNGQWLQDIGAGIPQGNPRYCDEWIFDNLMDGRLSMAAWNGLLYAQKMGTYKIVEIMKAGSIQREALPIKE
jgi:hypothetical protein